LRNGITIRFEEETTGVKVKRPYRSAIIGRANVKERRGMKWEAGL